MALVLVIDDEPRIRKMVQHVLAAAGHSVVEAADGSAAAQLLANRRPNVVVTDILMPEADGFETIFTIRRLAPTVKIVAMSGSGNNGGFDFLGMAERAGADATLAKPFRAAELVAVVDRLAADPPSA